MKKNWDYKGIKKQGVHTLGKYPAMMVPKMQLDLLEKFCSSINDATMLDPFMGSGTALVEAQKMGMKTIGIDLNPYAVLLSKVKTHNYSLASINSIKKFIKKLDSNQFDLPIWNFPNIKKWFREDIIISLSKIRNTIMSEKDLWVRRYLWVILSEVIYTYSNDRTSTFKLHVKTDEQINKMKNNVLDEFRCLVSTKYHLLHQSCSSESRIYSGNSESVCKLLDDHSVDIICTSPPYGDNATTVTYGQASILFLKWINYKDIDSKTDEKLIQTYSKIDSLSLGGRNNLSKNYESLTLSNYLNSINLNKRRKVQLFMNDYWGVIKQLVRIIKRNGIIIFTVGNRKVDRKTQPLDKITCEMFSSLGFCRISEITRNILDKKMPLKVSNVSKLGSVDSMRSEKVLVFERKN